MRANGLRHSTNGTTSWCTDSALLICRIRQRQKIVQLKHWWHRQVTSIDEEPEIPVENAMPIEETLEAVRKLPVKYKVNDPFADYDTITAYYKTLYHAVSYNGGSYVTDSIYERKYLSGKDPYATFLNSNQSVTVVSGGGEGKLLILKDSYANCFAQFVIDDYEETHLIDLRFFRESVSDYIAENSITQVLVLYNIPNFVQDTALVKTLR